jgi:hypothetical protein
MQAHTEPADSTPKNPSSDQVPGPRPQPRAWQPVAASHREPSRRESRAPNAARIESDRDPRRRPRRSANLSHAIRPYHSSNARSPRDHARIECVGLGGESRPAVVLNVVRGVEARRVGLIAHHDRLDPAPSSRRGVCSSADSVNSTGRAGRLWPHRLSGTTKPHGRPTSTSAERRTRRAGQVSALDH